MLFPDIQEALDVYLEKQKDVYPCRVNRISQIGHECERFLYYSRHNWKDQVPPNNRLQGAFSTGNILEPVIERIISEVGASAVPAFRIVGAQTPTDDRLLNNFQISGSIDGFLQVKGHQDWFTAGVVDIKTSSPNVFATLDGVESLSRYAWTKRYIAQLTLYALAHNQEHCVLLFVNKSNLYDMKLIGWQLDMGFAESLLQKAKRVNEALEKDEPPEKVNDPNICKGCQFEHICIPEFTVGDGVAISTDEDLEALLIRREELSETSKEARAVDRQIDKKLEAYGHKQLVAGDFIILWKSGVRHIKAADAHKVETWSKKIIKTLPDPVNLIALCRSCNARVNTNRAHWTRYFSAKE